jgi:hypothetical protein
MDYYRKNMRVLKRKNRSLYNRLRDYAQSDNVILEEKSNEKEPVTIVKDLDNNINIYVEKARSGDYTIRVDYKDKDIYFHSKYDPNREAERQIKKFKPRDSKQIFALGFGLGYHLNKLAERNKFDKIIIIEPYMSIFYTALKFVDLSSLLKNDKIIYVIEGKPALFDVVRGYFSMALEKDISFLEQSPSVKLFEEEYKDIYQQIREGINYKKTTLATNIQWAREWRRNIILNIPYIFENPKADDFFEEFKDLPVICVSAGPSLDKNKDFQFVRVFLSSVEKTAFNNFEPLDSTLRVLWIYTAS